MNMNHLLYVDRVAKSDSRQVKEREQTYRGSWKKRGGIGAFMMLARKWDRLETLMENVHSYDIFSGVDADASGRDGSVLAELRDLRQYLLLVESEMVARKRVTIQNPDLEVPDQGVGLVSISVPGTPEDGGQHGLSNGQG